MTDKTPQASERLNALYIDPSARLFGDVRLAKSSSVWPQAVLRADMHFIEVGEMSNVQDFVMLHVGYQSPTVIGKYCSITHHAVLHGCTIGDNCLIGIHATVMDGAQIGANSIVAPHSLVREGFVAPPNSLLAGVPAKVVKQNNYALDNRMNAWMYSENAKGFARGEYRTWMNTNFQDAAKRQRLLFQSEL